MRFCNIRKISRLHLSLLNLTNFLWKEVGNFNKMKRAKFQENFAIFMKIAYISAKSLFLVKSDKAFLSHSVL